jgi:hypothetical protein
LRLSIGNGFGREHGRERRRKTGGPRLEPWGVGGDGVDNGVWWEERERERGWDKNRGRGDDTF